VCLIGVSDVNGPLWISTQLVELEVAAPFVTGKSQMAAIEQGAAGQVTCELTQQNKFEGKAKVELLGLPANTSAEPRKSRTGAGRGEEIMGAPRVGSALADGIFRRSNACDRVTIPSAKADPTRFAGRMGISV